MASPHRTRRPVVFLAHGPAGATWLRSVAARATEDPDVREMVEEQVVQFWAVLPESDAGPEDPVQRVSGRSEALAVRARLNAARAVRNQARFGLDLQGPLLIVERWSLFVDGWQDRTALRGAFERARHVDCDPALAPELDYQWISLADTVRPPGRPDAAVVERIRAAFVPEQIHDVPFLIDTASEQGGEVDPAMADWCFLDLAVGLVTSDFGFPNTGAGAAGQSQVLALGMDTGQVYPVGVLSLRHSSASVLDSQERALLCALRDGNRPRELLQAVLRPPTLSPLVGEEKREMELGQYSAALARERRERAALELLHAVLVHKDFAGALLEVERARMAARRAFPAADVLPPASTGGAAPALFLLQGELPEILPWLIGLVLAVVGGGAAWAARRRHRSSQELPPPGPPVAIEVAEARAQWERLCGALEETIRAWRTRVEEDASVAAEPAWAPDAEHPFDWELVRIPSATGGPAPLEPDAYERIARRALRFALDGAGDPLREAVRAEAERLLQERPEIVRGALRLALREPHSGPVQRAVRSAPLLAAFGPRVPVHEVLWLCAPALEIEDALRDLEAPASRSVTRVLSGDDGGRTVRIAIGESRPWTGVLSLAFLKQA